MKDYNIFYTDKNTTLEDLQEFISFVHSEKIFINFYNSESFKIDVSDNCNYYLSIYDMDFNTLLPTKKLAVKSYSNIYDCLVIVMFMMKRVNFE